MRTCLALALRRAAPQEQCTAGALSATELTSTLRVAGRCTARSLHATSALPAAESWDQQQDQRNEKGWKVPAVAVGGACILAALQAQHLYRQRTAAGGGRGGAGTNNHVSVYQRLRVRDAIRQASVVTLIPRRTATEAWRRVCEVELPVWLRSPLFRAYSAAYDGDPDEAALALQDYPSLQAYLMRRLKLGARRVDPTPGALVSPVDGIVLHTGSADVETLSSTVISVKGFDYSLADLLGGAPLTPAQILSAQGSEWQRRSNAAHSPGAAEQQPVGDQGSGRAREPSSGGRAMAQTQAAAPGVGAAAAEEAGGKRTLHFAVIYLPPGSYHHIHSPGEWTLYRQRHVGGQLWPLDPRVQAALPRPIATNERIVLEGLWPGGYLGLVAVGALLLGSVDLAPELVIERMPERRHLDAGAVIDTAYSTPVELPRGSEVGVFRAGSAVVLVAEALLSAAGPKEGRFGFGVRAGDRVCMGERLDAL